VAPVPKPLQAQQPDRFSPGAAPPAVPDFDKEDKPLAAPAKKPAATGTSGATTTPKTPKKPKTDNQPQRNP
jgi:hypothetical protein